VLVEFDPRRYAGGQPGQPGFALAERQRTETRRGLAATPASYEISLVTRKEAAQNYEL
jgi:hypothetical protein